MNKCNALHMQRMNTEMIPTSVSSGERSGVVECGVAVTYGGGVVMCCWGCDMTLLTTGDCWEMGSCGGGEASKAHVRVRRRSPRVRPSVMAFSASLRVAY